MTILESIFFGFLQGVTEFLPVSSSGHLAVSKNLLGLGSVPVLFDVLLHVATLLVVLAVFRRKVLLLIMSLGSLFRKEKTDEQKSLHMTILSILIATFFTACIGLGLDKLDIQEAPRLVSVFFIVTAVLLFLPRFIKPKSAGGPGVKSGVIVGIAQGLGVIPGISRSGITITASLLSGLSREDAGEYAFLISLPAILGALLLSLKDGGELMSQVSIPVMAVGFVTSFAVGLASLLLLLRFVKKGKLYYFSYYLLPLGVIGLFAFS